MKIMKKLKITIITETPTELVIKEKNPEEGIENFLKLLTQENDEDKEVKV